MDTSVDSNYQGFDNETLEYDLNKFNIPDWVSNILIENFNLPKGITLTDLHLYIKPEQIKEAQILLYKSFETQEFKSLIDSFCEQNITPIVKFKEYLVQSIPNIRIVIPNQTTVHQRLQFHQGIWFGNGVGVRTIWIPITKTLNTNTMYVVDLERSRSITKSTISNQLPYEDFERLALETARPVNLSPGQCHLFSQEHLHGNVENTENVTRISIDMRILFKGQPCGRKLPGGYFRRLRNNPPFKHQTKSGKNITYAGWNSDYTRHIPLHFQRAVIANYCKQKSIKIIENVMEFDSLDWTPCLIDFLQPGLNSVVILSIYALPDSEEHRMAIYNKAFNMNIAIHFVNEDISFTAMEDIDLIEYFLTYSPKTVLYE